jgi:serine/threonine-protein kinase
MVGSTLHGTYQILRAIGKGGMGAIFEAASTRLAGRRFAIKVLHQSFADSPELLVRFKREAEIASQLGHEHIVEVIDFNVTDAGMAYMVMELLDGEDLASRLAARGPMPLHNALLVLWQTVSALEAAHAAHVVHRDLKPQNIFLCRRGGRDDFVKILDFGVSKMLDSASVVTRDNALVGTPYYMSPEQADGRVSEIDARTDVFALAAIVWEMLAGQMAFGGPSFSAALYKVLFTEPAEIHTLRPDVPPGVSLALRRGMAKQREARTPSVREMWNEIDAAVRAAGLSPSAAMPAQSPSQAGFAPTPYAGTPIPSRPPSVVPQPAVRPPSHVGFASQHPLPPSHQPIVAPPLPSYHPPPSYAPPPPPSMPSMAPPRRARWPIALAAGVGVAGAVGVALVAMLPRGAEPPAAVVDPPQVPRFQAPVAPVDAASSDVEVRVQVEPAEAGALITVDGVVFGGVTWVPRGKEIELGVEADGYLPYRDRVRADDDVFLAVTLRKEPRPEPEPVAEAPKPEPEPVAETPKPERPRPRPAPPKPEPEPEPAYVPPPEPEPEPQPTYQPPVYQPPPPQPVQEPPPPPKKKRTGTIFD